MKILNSIENLTLQNDELLFDGASFYHYILCPASKEIKNEFGIMWIVKPCKSSRRVFKNKGDPTLLKGNKSCKFTSIY